MYRPNKLEKLWGSRRTPAVCLKEQATKDELARTTEQATTAADSRAAERHHPVKRDEKQTHNGDLHSKQTVVDGKRKAEGQKRQEMPKNWQEFESRMAQVPEDYWAPGEKEATIALAKAIFEKSQH